MLRNCTFVEIYMEDYVQYFPNEMKLNFILIFEILQTKIKKNYH